MNRWREVGFWKLLTIVLVAMLADPEVTWGQVDKQADLKALPQVPPQFEISLFASEPLVRQPCSMAFDQRGRLFVGMGPQYRNPKPETPGDSVLLVLDTNGDGRADRTTTFATGFNAIQGLAWHGRDLWVANSPDLTIVRDLDGDDEADEYVKLYTDLGNLEHGLHGLNWAPDGRLYMSKGNSKGLNQPGRYAPKAFRELWGVQAPADVPDIPPAVITNRQRYQRAYHDPADDWGLDGGILRCDDGGRNLEIVARGFRNPWDITLDSGFNWIGTDNDQTTGDRVFMPFDGAHFGWNHPWSSHWSTEPHDATAPVSGPLFEGSGTGVVFCQSPQFPPDYRGTFLINDWLLKTTYIWRPEWDGALLRPAGGKFIPFIQGGSSLFRPTDLEFGPDGALWILGWSSGYGAEWKDGQLTNEGRIFRVTWKGATPARSLLLAKPLSDFTIPELIADLDCLLPVRRIDAQDELVRRASRDVEVVSQLIGQLKSRKLSENQETWVVWSLGRTSTQTVKESIQNNLLSIVAQSNSLESLNLRIQALRIFAFRARQFRETDQLVSVITPTLRDQQPRIRMAAVQAIRETHSTNLVPALLNLLETEQDRTVFYAGWQSLRSTLKNDELEKLVNDTRSAVRRAALLALLENHAAKLPVIQSLAKHDQDAEVRRIAGMWLAKSGNQKPEIRGRALEIASAGTTNGAMATPSGSAAGIKVAEQPGVSPIRKLRARSKAAYQVVPNGFRMGSTVYVDRGYRLTSVPRELEGADLIQTANNDDNSTGERWLTAEAIVPIDVWVGIDLRQKKIPNWLEKNFRKESPVVSIDEGARFAFYRREFPAGRVELGGNTDDGLSGGKGNYVIAVTMSALQRQPERTTIENVQEVLNRADRDRGELLFRHSQGAGCIKCHSLDQAKNGFGPNLRAVGLRANTQHLVQSIVDPSAVITEGFRQLTIVTQDGKVYSGVLLEESGLTISLGQSTGERVDLPKAAIEERRVSAKSAMPELSDQLTPQQVADLTLFLQGLRTP